MALIEFQNNTSPYLNAENLNNNFNYLDEKNDYSTDEKVIGKWINGKPIYRKVIDFGALPNATTKNVSLNITDLDEVTNFYARTKSETITRIIPTSSPADVSYNMDIYVNGSNIVINTGTDRSSYTAYVVVEYTKTTDEGDE